MAADQFLITPAGRTDDATRARAVGDEVRTVIAGYHWFTDWGRDTMISLEGLTLSHRALCGAGLDSSHFLALYSRWLDSEPVPRRRTTKGCIIPPTRRSGFFTRLIAIPKLSGDRSVCRLVLPKLLDIFEWHMRGTAFRHRVDPRDGFLKQGAEGYALTWMDAKVEDWVVTPRRGKAVEINALWYNALRLLEGWLTRTNEREQAERVRQVRRNRRANRSTRDSGMSRASISMTWSTGRKATIPPAVRINCWRFPEASRSG